MIDGSVTKEGKTVEEALQKALRQMGASKEHCIIEVLAKGSRGIFGLWAKPAKVRVTLKDEVVAERKLKHLLTDLDLKPTGVSFSLAETAAASTEAVSADKHKVGPADGSPAGNPYSCENPTGLAVEGQPDPAGSDEESTQKVGTVMVKDGKIIVTNPVNDDRKAVIRFEKNVKAVLNGQLVEGEIEISEDDSLEIEMVNDEPVSSLELKLTKNNMEADLKFISQPGAKYRLKDQAPANKLTLLAEVETILEPAPKNIDDVKEFLQEQGIVQGIDEAMLNTVLENPNGMTGYLVASGQPPVHGVDATARYPFREEQEEENDDSYFSRNKLISVNPGDVIAVKVSKIEGQDGWTVKGEPIPAKPALDCQITVRNGCELIADGDKVISNISGRPVVEVSGPNITIGVDPVYVVKEVSQATGNIKFAGDVEVQGNVGDGSVIEADGNVQVAGDVSRAVIRAGTSVVLHKIVIGSTIVAGGRAALYSSVLPVLKQIKELLGKVSTDAKTLQANSGSVSPGKPINDGRIIQLMIDSKFNELPKTIDRLWNIINASGISPHEEVVEFVGLLRKNLCGLGPTQIEKIQLVDDLANALDHIIIMVENSMKKADYIKVRYVQNCSLLSSGDVIIEGQGCYISDIKAGGAVIICGKPGIARGVKIVAGGNVTVADLGSEFESQTSIKVGDSSKVSAELVHPDVLIQVGNEKYRVDKASRSFEAYKDSTGRLMVDRLTAEEK